MWQVVVGEGVLTWTHHHPSTDHNLPHGRVVAQVVPFVVALEPLSLSLSLSLSLYLYIYIYIDSDSCTYQLNKNIYI